MRSKTKRIHFTKDEINGMFYGERHFNILDELGIMRSIYAKIIEDNSLVNNREIMTLIPIPHINTFEVKFKITRIKGNVAVDVARSGAKLIHEAYIYHSIRHTVYHEAGHSVLSFIFGRRIDYVEVDGPPWRGEIKHVVQFVAEGASLDSIRQEILIKYAGMIAERIQFGVHGQGGPLLDLEAKNQLIGRLLTETETYCWDPQKCIQMEETLKREVEELLKTEKTMPAIKEVARELWNRAQTEDLPLRIPGNEVEKIISAFVK